MAEKKKKKSALIVNPGIEQPLPVSEESVIKFKKIKKKQYHVDDYIDGIVNCDRTLLSQAITLVESSRPEDQIIARKIIERCLPYSGNSVRIGITGVPGVGKSTFIESLGLYITALGKKLAVLAIDPSSERSKGSILGDKTRMEVLSVHPAAYIRPSPSGGSLGGVARKTSETILLCEAAGFDTLFIETVGVGQSETTVHSMVDFFLLLMLSGAGDELQGIKRGIMEMADAIVITKTDGTNTRKAQLAKTTYENALHLFPPKDSGWMPKVLTCSALTNSGIDVVWDTITEYLDCTKNNKYFEANRREQSRFRMYEAIDEAIKDNFYNHHAIRAMLKELEPLVLTGKISSFVAAKKLLIEYFK